MQVSAWKTYSDRTTYLKTLKQNLPNSHSKDSCDSCVPRPDPLYYRAVLSHECTPSFSVWARRQEQARPGARSHMSGGCHHEDEGSIVRSMFIGDENGQIHYSTGIVSCVWLDWKGLTGGLAEECCQPLGIPHTTGNLRMDEITRDSWLFLNHCFARNWGFLLSLRIKFVLGLSGCRLPPTGGLLILKITTPKNAPQKASKGQVFFFFFPAVFSPIIINIDRSLETLFNGLHMGRVEVEQEPPN